MEPASKLDNVPLEQAHTLVKELDAGNSATAEELTGELARQRELRHADGDN